MTAASDAYMGFTHTLDLIERDIGNAAAARDVAALRRLAQAAADISRLFGEAMP